MGAQLNTAKDAARQTAAQPRTVSQASQPTAASLTAGVGREVPADPGRLRQEHAVDAKVEPRLATGRDIRARRREPITAGHNCPFGEIGLPQ